MTAVAIGPLACGDPAHYPVLAASPALLVGLLMLVGWRAQLGSWLTCCRGRCWSAIWPGWR
jgi:hypothetical protein